jgi:NADPH:quinone reductase-like Zn-dependent oxidoreductase
MQAILVKDDAAHSFYLAEAPTPKPAPDAVLIKIYATAVNRADLLQRRGLYPPPLGESDIIGLEAAGVIVEKGVNIILDCVGGKYLLPNLSLLPSNGRLVLIGLLGGAKAEIDLALVLRKRLRLIGSVLRSRSLAEKVAKAD